jgi:hypothetical protein
MEDAPVSGASFFGSPRCDEVTGDCSGRTRKGLKLVRYDWPGNWTCANNATPVALANDFILERTMAPINDIDRIISGLRR